MPYWRLSGVYFSYFAVVGALSPYWSLYLKDLDYDARQIGILAAVPLLTKLFAPNLWSWVGDRFGKRMLTIRLGALGGCVFFTGILFRTDYFGLLILLIFYSLFWNAILPQFEAATLSYLKDKHQHYSRVRVWGSMGFIATVLLLGALFERYPISWLPTITLFFLFGIFFFCCLLPPIPSTSEKGRFVEFIGLLSHKHVVVFYLVLFFLQFSHGVYYVFYSIYLEMHGYQKFAIGVLWTIGVICEILIFIRMPTLLSRFNRFQLLSISLIATFIRWLLIGFYVSNVYIIAAAQVLHALSFGVIHAVAIDFIKSVFGEKSQGQGQAFYSAVSFGGGASLGAYISGEVWHLSPQLAFLVAAFAALISWLLTIVFLKTRL